MPITREPDETLDGEPVPVWTLENATGVSMRVLALGCIIQSLNVPSRTGNPDNVVLGYNTAQEYVSGKAYFGCIAGRYANRIGGASFVIDGETSQLTANDGPNTLHGGKVGFDKCIWLTEPEPEPDGDSLRFELTSPDGDQGFPGKVEASVTYRLTDQSELYVEYQAVTDRATHINLTQHTYWNLGGEGSGSIESHELMINANQFTPVDESLLPLDEPTVVAGTPFDFRLARPIGKGIRSTHPQIVVGRGYDHNYVLNRELTNTGLVRAAALYDPASQRRVSISTTEPGIQLYTGGFLDGNNVGSSGRPYQQSGGVALETQHFPNSPNRLDFPSTLIMPDWTYRSTTVYTFEW